MTSFRQVLGRRAVTCLCNEKPPSITVVILNRPAAAFQSVPVAARLSSETEWISIRPTRDKMASFPGLIKKSNTDETKYRRDGNETRNHMPWSFWPVPGLIKRKNKKTMADGRPPSWKSKNRDISVTGWPMSTKFGTIKPHEFLLNRVGRYNFQIFSIEDGRRRPFEYC